MPAGLLLPGLRLALEIDLHPLSGFRSHFEPVLPQVTLSAPVITIPKFAPCPQHTLNLDDLLLPPELSRQPWLSRAHASWIDRAFHWLNRCTYKMLIHAKTFINGLARISSATADGAGLCFHFS